MSCRAGLRRTWGQNPLAARDPDEPFDLTTYSLVLLRTADMLSFAGRAAEQPDYELEALILPPPFDDHEIHEMMTYVGNLAQVHVPLLIRAGECDEATSFALRMLHLSRRHPASSSATHLAAMDLQAKALQSLERIANSCREPGARRRLQASLDDLRPIIVLPLEKRAEVLDMLAAIREWKRDGYPVDFRSGQPGSELIETYEAGLRDYPAWKRQQLASDDPLRPIVESQATNAHFVAGQGSDSDGDTLSPREHPAPVTHEELVERQQAVAEQLQHLRQRLAELQTNPQNAAGSQQAQ
jgi:hypothetical protein